MAARPTIPVESVVDVPVVEVSVVDPVLELSGSLTSAATPVELVVVEEPVVVPVAVGSVVVVAVVVDESSKLLITGTILGEPVESVAEGEGVLDAPVEVVVVGEPVALGEIGELGAVVVVSPSKGIEGLLRAIFRDASGPVVAVGVVAVVSDGLGVTEPPVLLVLDPVAEGVVDESVGVVEAVLLGTYPTTGRLGELPGVVVPLGVLDGVLARPSVFEVPDGEVVRSVFDGRLTGGEATGTTGVTELPSGEPLGDDGDGVFDGDDGDGLPSGEPLGDDGDGVLDGDDGEGLPLGFGVGVPPGVPGGDTPSDAAALGSGVPGEGTGDWPAMGTSTVLDAPTGTNANGVVVSVGELVGGVKGDGAGLGLGDGDGDVGFVWPTGGMLLSGAPGDGDGDGEGDGDCPASDGVEATPGVLGDGLEPGLFGSGEGEGEGVVESVGVVEEGSTTGLTGDVELVPPTPIGVDELVAGGNVGSGTGGGVGLLVGSGELSPGMDWRKPTKTGMLSVPGSTPIRASFPELGVTGVKGFEEPPLVDGGDVAGGVVAPALPSFRASSPALGVRGFVEPGSLDDGGVEGVLLVPAVAPFRASSPAIGVTGLDGFEEPGSLDDGGGGDDDGGVVAPASPPFRAASAGLGDPGLGVTGLDGVDEGGLVGDGVTEPAPDGLGELGEPEGVSVLDGVELLAKMGSSTFPGVVGDTVPGGGVVVVGGGEVGSTVGGELVVVDDVDAVLVVLGGGPSVGGEEVVDVVVVDELVVPGSGEGDGVVVGKGFVVTLTVFPSATMTTALAPLGTAPPEGSTPAGTGLGAGDGGDGEGEFDWSPGGCGKGELDRSRPTGCGSGELDKSPPVGVEVLLKNCRRRMGKGTRAPSGEGGCGNASASETTGATEESQEQPASQTTIDVRILAGGRARGLSLSQFTRTSITVMCSQWSRKIPPDCRYAHDALAQSNSTPSCLDHDND
ncbi:MAG: hypothetical protein M1823_000092 [Watsoniomyces obsoletus]|nr:MAG: hypothetical protein M1823_000092 [Watsoniomyces obsoletus]